MEKCLELRQQGNDYYKNGEFQKSNSLYNSSLRHSKFRSSNYCYALANKSAAMFQEKKYSQAYDIILFLEPIAKLTMPLEFLQKLETRLQKCRKELIPPNKCYSRSVTPEGLSSPFQSSSITVRELASKGRSIICSNKIDPNETLLLLRPFAYTLGVEFWVSHCYTCLTCIEETVIIPCENCCEVQFCSENCCNENAFHYQYECPVIGLIKEIGIFHLSLVIAMTFYTNKNLDRLVRFYCENSEANFSSSYRNFALLNFSVKKRDLLLDDCSDVIESILQSYPMLWNGNEGGISSARMKCDMKFALATITAQMISNASSISFYNPYSKTHVLIGSGIYPELALMNHSCYSNTVCLFSGTFVTVKSISSIESGSEIFNSYGFDCESHTRDSRRKLLDFQYEFECNCDACADDWVRDEDFRHMACPKCCKEYTFPSDEVPTDNHCQVCSQITDFKSCLADLEAQYKTACDAFNSDAFEKATELLIQSQTHLELLKLPDSLLLDWNNLMRKSLIVSHTKV